MNQLKFISMAGHGLKIWSVYIDGDCYLNQRYLRSNFLTLVVEKLRLRQMKSQLSLLK